MAGVTSGVVLSFVAALLKAGKSVTTKMAAVETDEYVASFATRAVTVVFTATGVFLFGSFYLPTEPVFWLAAAINVTALTLSTIFLTRGFKLADVSIVSPLMAFVPATTLFPALVILGQVPTVVAGAGVFLVTVGAYVLNLHQSTDGILEPIRAITSDPGARATILGVLVVAPVPTFDVIGVAHSSELMWVTLIHLGTSISILAIAHRRSSLSSAEGRGEWKILAVVGLFNAFLWVAQIRAYMMIDVVYVQSIKRVSILLVILFGYLWWDEGHVRQRLFGGAIMVVGVVLIIVGA